MRVRLLDPRSLAGGDLIEDLLQALGLSRAALGVGEVARRNVTPSWKAVETLRAVFTALSGMPEAAGDARLLMRVSKACIEAVDGAEAGGERAEYLTLEQRRRAAELTLRDVELFNRHLPAPGLPVPEFRDGPERPFLPSVEHVPPADLARAMARLALLLSCTRFPWTGICPTGDRHGEVQHGRE